MKAFRLLQDCKASEMKHSLFAFINLSTVKCISIARLGVSIKVDRRIDSPSSSLQLLRARHLHRGHGRGHRPETDTGLVLGGIL